MKFLNEFRLNKALKRTKNTHKGMLRLVYVEFVPYIDRYHDTLMCGARYATSSAFELPKNMTMEQACKVVSYLSEKVEKENNLEPASDDSVRAVSHILEDYGFIRDKNIAPFYAHLTANKNYIRKPTMQKTGIQGVADLITYGGDSGCFKRSDIYPRYFNWFVPGVKKSEIDTIYKDLDVKPSNKNIKSPNVFSSTK